MDDVLVGSRVFCDSCIDVFMRACYPLSLVSGAGTTIHTWVDVELRVVGQHVAVNIKNPNRSWVHNLGPQQKSTFLPWTGVLKGGLGFIRGFVLGHLARTKMLGLPEQFGVARLLEDVEELVSLGCPLSVIRGLVHSLPCSRVVHIGRKNCANVGFSLQESNGASLRDGSQAASAPSRESPPSIGRVAVESQGIVVEAQLGRALPCPPAFLEEDVEGECGERERLESFWRSSIHSTSS